MAKNAGFEPGVLAVVRNGPVSLAAHILTQLERHRGSLVAGFPEKTTTRVLGDIHRLCGLHLVVVWDFHDCEGYGGAACLCVIDSKGRVCLGADEWQEYLTMGARDAHWAERLASVRPGRVLDDWRKLRRYGLYSLCRKLFSGRAPARVLGDYSQATNGRNGSSPLSICCTTM